MLLRVDYTMLEALGDVAKTIFGYMNEDEWVETTINGKRIDPLNRKPPKREFFFPMEYYDPLFGVPGMTERPTTRSGRLNFPVQLRENASLLFGGEASHKNPDHFINDPKYWEHYRYLKNRHSDFNYDPMMQLTGDHFLVRPSVRVRNIATGETLYTLANQKTPSMTTADDFYHGHVNYQQW